MMFRGEDTFHLSRHVTLEFGGVTFRVRCLKTRRVVPRSMCFVLCPNKKFRFGAFSFSDTVTSVVYLDILEELLIPSRFWKKRVQTTC